MARDTQVTTAINCTAHGVRRTVHGARRTAWDWVSTQLGVVAHGDGERERRTVTAHGLRELYTSHVIGDEMMLLWNNGFGLLSHEVGAGVDPTVARLALVGRFARFIIEELLKVDSHPTVTRFFTFRGILDRMLTMLFIGMPAAVLRVMSTHRAPAREDIAVPTA